MSGDEKKFKLADLPDQGSEPEKKTTPAPRSKTLPDPRLKDLKKKTSAEKDEMLSQRWYFDRPVYNYGWFVALTGLLVLEKSGHMEAFSPKNLQNLENETAGIANLVIDSLHIQDIVRHPLYLAVLIPLFFKFTRTQGLHFEINFSGIEAVEKINFVYGQTPRRVFLKWSDIEGAQFITVNKRPVLELQDAKGPRAQLIWDIDDVKKKVIKQILKGLVTNKHPLRILIEKEVT